MKKLKIMKIDISKIIVSLLCVVLCSCGESSKKSDGVVFYPNIGVVYFHVNYKEDSILIKEKYNYKKYEYLADTTIFHGVEEDNITMLFIKKNEEYYLNKDGYSELFMSNKITYSDSTYHNDMEGVCHSIRIKEVKDSLYESTLFANVTENHRNPLLTILYDKHYKIKNIKSGAIYVDYVMENKENNVQEK